MTETVLPEGTPPRIADRTRGGDAFGITRLPPKPARKRSPAVPIAAGAVVLLLAGKAILFHVSREAPPAVAPPGHAMGVPGIPATTGSPGDGHAPGGTPAAVAPPVPHPSRLPVDAVEVRPPGMAAAMAPPAPTPLAPPPDPTLPIPAGRTVDMVPVPEVPMVAAPAEVTATTPEAEAPVPEVQASPAPAPSHAPVPRLEYLTRRAESLIAQGDVSAARMLARRAADAGDPDGFSILARSYDPAVLASLGVRGVRPDPDLARSYYERARDAGAGGPAGGR